MHYFHPLLGSLMYGNQHDMFTKFLKFQVRYFLVRRLKMLMSSSWIVMRGCINWEFFTNMVLSLCPFKFKVRPSNGGELIWNAYLLHYLRFVGPNFMPSF